MRKIADISFEATLESPTASSALLSRVSGAVDAWISSKGVHKPLAEQENFLLQDGRVATLTRKTTNLKEGTSVQVRVKEPLDLQTFETDMRFALVDSTLAVACELRLGAASPGAPIHFEAHVPRVVRDIVGLTDSWMVAGTPVSTRAATFSGSSGGADLASVLWHDDRSVPVIVVSDYNGLLLAPAIHDVLARECAGVALVARADREACWQLTALRGTEWSCYNGAVRLYYPRISNEALPRQHPLWVQRVVDEAGDPASTGKRLRALLRRLVLSYSAFSTYEPSALTHMRTAIDAGLRQSMVVAVQSDQEWQSMATLYALDNDRLQLEAKALHDEVADLRLQLSNLQAALVWQQHIEVADAPPEQAAPPATVDDAIEQAKALFGDEIVFGSSVPEGVNGVAPDSGPPEKVLTHLKELAELAQARRKGPLGEDIITWLRKKGVNCSGESESVRNSKEERARRTWDDGFGTRRHFELHTKPTDATSPDRCVRIYFEYDSDRTRTIVGWVGRKPGL